MNSKLLKMIELAGYISQEDLEEAVEDYAEELYSLGFKEGYEEGCKNASNKDPDK